MQQVYKNPNKFVVVFWRFYAFYQFSALGSHLLPTARMSDLGYNALIAIQSSAFLMTLFRKGLIEYYSHAFWYTCALIVSVYHMYVLIPSSLLFFAKVLVAFTVRLKFGVNKYIIWTSFVLLSFPAVEQVAVSMLQPLLPMVQPLVEFSGQFAQERWLQLSAGAAVGLLGFAMVPSEGSKETTPGPEAATTATAK